jgi:hypothetical protein
VVTTLRDAGARLGRPLPHIADILKVGVDRGGVFAITNADILLSPAFDLARVAGELAEGTALIAHRIDVAAPDERSGKPYPVGFDFFVLHARDAARIPELGLWFGAPWWDHWVPIALALAGVDVRVVREPCAFHLQHEERWNLDWWMELGLSYEAELDAWSARLVEPSARAQALRHALGETRRLPSLRRRLRWLWNARTAGGRRLNARQRLDLLSWAAVRHLDAHEALPGLTAQHAP